MFSNQHEIRHTLRIHQRSLKCTKNINYRCHLTMKGQPSSQTSVIQNTRGPNGPYPLGRSEYAGAASVST